MQTAGTSLLRSRNFLLVWGGQSVSMLGSRVSYIALMWWVLEKTDSAAAIAVVGIAAALPSLLLGPLAGAFIDRVDRRRVMIAVNAINGLLVGAAGFLLVSQALQVWEVYLLTVLSSTAMAFHRPSLQASIPNLVGKDQLTRANSFYQVSRSVSGLIGLALGGVLVGLIGTAPTLWFDAATFFLAGGSLLFAAFPSPRTSEGQGWWTILEDTVSGFRFLRGNKTLLFMMLLFGLINFLLAPTSVLFPIMARDVLRAGAEGFGLLSAAVSAGMLLGGLMTASLKRFKRYGIAVIWGLVAVGTLLALFGISRDLLLSLGVLAILGVFVAVVNVFESVIFQSHVPNELQGRVFAAQFAVCDGLQPVSLAAIGGLLVLVSAPAVLVGSGVAVVLASLGGFAVRGMKEL
jgi:DHA3 family macrolide efflux protein-like MFS transporter